MRIKTKTSITHGGKHFEPGVVIEIDDIAGRRLLRLGGAEKSKAPLTRFDDDGLVDDEEPAADAEALAADEDDAADEAPAPPPRRGRGRRAADAETPATDGD